MATLPQSMTVITHGDGGPPEVLTASTAPLPQLKHGGPGRAGGGA